MLKDKDGNLTPVAWEDALVSVAKMLDSTPSDQIAAVAGGLCDAEVNIATKSQIVINLVSFSVPDSFERSVEQTWH